MDGIFGHSSFRNEITWKRTEAHNTPKGYGNVADTILYYTASERATWNPQHTAYSEAQLSRFKNEDKRGPYRLDDLTAPRPDSESGKREWRGTMPSKNRGWGYKLEQLEQWWAEGRIRTKRDGTPRMDGLKSHMHDAEGQVLQNIWTDIPRVANTGRERMGYDTQKPLALLDRIIKASTNEGDTVLDPFCGCATALEAAHRLKRRWMGIDIAIHAIKRVAAIRLGERCKLKEGEDFRIDGVPRTLEGAQDLWERDKYHFQKWAVEEVDGFVTTNRTADGGIDGRLYFALPSERDLQSMVLEVKGGVNVTIADLRALHSVLEREEALMAGLIVMRPLGDVKMRNFRRLIAEAGDLEVPDAARPHARMQILSVPEILEGKRFDTPAVFGKSGNPQSEIQL